MSVMNKSNEIKLLRVFEAPVKAVWEAWTDDNQVSQWWGPRGHSITTHSKELRAGGAWRLTMHGPNGVEYKYREIRKPHLIVYTQEFCDVNEKPARHPLMATWPAKMLTTVKLAEEGKKRTRVTVTWQCYGETPSEDLETFVNGKAGATIGWTGSFDKLDSHLENC
jgi:uncharacterized protein YndB with AHSA1/START domain